MLKLLIISSNQERLLMLKDFFSHRFICIAATNIDVAQKTLLLQVVDAVILDSPTVPAMLLKSAPFLPFFTVCQLNNNRIGICHHSSKSIIFAEEAIMQMIATQINENEVLQVLGRFIGASASAQMTKQQIQTYAATEEPVLIVGESGTGKEIAAMMIHQLSIRKNEKWLPVNVAAIPETLVESEFFGVKRGAYTDAIQRDGFFSIADKGTLFLDEIENISPLTQSKLLRVLDYHEVTPLGCAVSRKSDIRLIAASNKSLTELKQTYRPDFFYRICNLVLDIPPLRERKEDIPLLLRHFATQMNNSQEISSSALDKLLSYSWPGNIRELKACYHRACILSRDIIQPSDILFF